MKKVHYFLPVKILTPALCFFLKAQAEDPVSDKKRYAELLKRDTLVEKILSEEEDLPFKVSGFSKGEFIIVPKRFPGYRVVRAVKPFTKKGEECQLDKDKDSLKILGFSPDGEKALLRNFKRYFTQGNEKYDCPDRALFLVSVEELVLPENRHEEEMERHEETISMIEQNRALAEEILLGEMDKLPTGVSVLSQGESINIPDGEIFYIAATLKGFKRKGDYCKTRDGDSVKIIAFSQDSEKALVTFDRFYYGPDRDNTISIRAICDGEMLFVIPVKDLISFKKEEMAINRKQEESFLLGEAEGFPTEVSGFSIGDFINIPKDRLSFTMEPTESQHSKGLYILKERQSCAVKQGGYLEILRFTVEGDKALVKYFKTGLHINPYYCLNGALFFISTKELAQFEELAGKPSLWRRIQSDFLE